MMLLLGAFQFLLSASMGSVITRRITTHQVPLETQDTSQSTNFIDKSIYGLSRNPLQSDEISSSKLSLDANKIYRADDASLTDDTPYIGISTFAHLNWVNCFDEMNSGTFDIGVVGAPFDLGVTYRPGARFGPAGTRMGSRRLAPNMAYSMDHQTNPFLDWASVVDCGDIPNSPFDKVMAIKELALGSSQILKQAPKNKEKGETVRLITIGGDHTITLPALRATFPVWGPVAVLHFDSHLDTWDPVQIGGNKTEYAEITHGTMLHIAHEEGLLTNRSMHIGSRSKLIDKYYDLNHDESCGFSYIRAREMDDQGADKIVQRIVEHVHGQLVYVTIDIDVLDPAFTPGTGTIEPGGWTSRELLHILSGLSNAGLKIIGADVVEFTPIYDNSAETTAIVVTEIIYEILQWMVKVPISAFGPRNR